MYPPDIPYVTSLFENRAYALTDWRLTAFGTARTRTATPVIYFVTINSINIIIIIIINNVIGSIFHFSGVCNPVLVQAS